MASNVPSSPSERLKTFFEMHKNTFWEKLARLVKELCEQELRKRGIPAIVTYRVKEDESLTTKLLRKESEKIAATHKPFATLADIYKYCPDIAGVRIALYFPSQFKAVKDMLDKNFEIVDEATHPRLEKSKMLELNKSVASQTAKLSNKDEYQPTFSGYQAKHVYVRFTKRPFDDYKNEPIEVQIQSVVMNAWSEVEHDIIYKSIVKEATQGERRILDALNGMMLSAALILDQLHTLVETRITISESPFEHPDDLSSHLRAALPSHYNSSKLKKVLHQFLQVVDKNRPDRLDSVLEVLDLKQGNTDHFGEKLEQTVEEFRGLDRSLRIPVGIMAHILSTLSRDDMNNARNRNKDFRTDYTQPRGKLRLMVQSLQFLMKELHTHCDNPYHMCRRAGMPRNMLLSPPFHWLVCTGRRVYVLQGEEPREDEKTLINGLWQWHEDQQVSATYRFLHQLAKLGLFESVDIMTRCIWSIRPKDQDVPSDKKCISC